MDEFFEEFQNKKSTKFKVYAEAFGALVLLVLILFLPVLFFLYRISPVEENIPTSDELNNPEVVEIDFDNSDSQQVSNDNIQIENISGSIFIVFDDQDINIKTDPNNVVEFRTNGRTDSKISNPNGTVSFEVPSNLAQFSRAEINVLDDDGQILFSKRILLLFSEYLGRNYFYLPKQGEIFSFEQLNQTDFTAANSLQSLRCSFNHDTNFNSSAFSFTESEDTVIMPFSISNLNFTENKYVVFEVKDNLEINDDFCINQLKEKEPTLKWHTDVLKNVLSFRPVVSGEVGI